MKENKTEFTCGAVDSATGELLIYKQNKFQKKERSWWQKLLGLNKANKMDVWSRAKFYKQAKGTRECFSSSIFGGRVHRWEEKFLIDIFVREHKFTGEKEFWYVKGKRKKVYLDGDAIEQGVVVERQ